MKKILSYLKPHAFFVILCFVFLSIQGICDLILPNYMSDIVNIGIQQNGIVDSSPEAISENGYILVKSFMTDDEKKLVDKNYILIQTGLYNDAYKKYVSLYPSLQNQNIYVLNNTEERSDLNDIFNNAYLSMTYILKSSAPESSDYINESSDINFSKIYDLIPYFKNISKESLQNVRSNITSIDPYLYKQTSLYITKQFYSEIGLDINSIQNNYIFRIGLYMILFTLLSVIAAATVSFLAAKIVAKVAKTLRHNIFSKIESFSNNEFDQFSTASLITRTTNDITQIQTFLINSIRIICYAPIIAVGGIIMALSKSFSMGWVILLGVVVLLCLIFSVFSIAIPKFNLVQKLIDKFTLVTRENLTGVMVIRAFNTQKFEEKRFDDANLKLTKTNLFINRIIAIMSPSMMIIMNIIPLLIVWVGSKQIEASQMQVGDMIAFMQYSMQIIMAFLMIAVTFIFIPRATVSANRIAEVLETEPSIKDSKNPININKNNIKGKLEFKNVSFKYEDAKEDVIENVSFTALPSQTTAFIGSTGSGKSTLINLVPRFYNVTEGEILIDGINIKDISQNDLHDIIGYIPQKGLLFSGDIESNLRYGDENADEEDLKVAADVSQATEFINSNPNGFKYKISQSGSNVSGGQRQRLSIARALVKKAPIYIFDDSFSALDFKTDAALRKALNKYTKNSTILIVAQRISTIMDADQIIVLDNGKIVGVGKHKDLLKDCETYREIALSQLPKEEL